MADVLNFPDQSAPDMRGPIRDGCSVILEGRKIPNLHMYERDDEILFVLDGRLMFGFPRDMAYQAATFAANAMAIGAGYPHLTADEKFKPFAPKCMELGEMPTE